MDDDENLDIVELELKKYIDLSLGRKKYGDELKLWRDDPTPFWCMRRHEFPLMSRVWRRIDTIKGTSCGSERIFSLGGFILMGRRWCMDPASLEAVVLQHRWYHDGLI